MFIMSTTLKIPKKKLFSPGVKAHFVGIGGIGMCGLAEILHTSGTLVTGSDLMENKQVTRLKRKGIPIYIGHKKENINNADIVIHSSAIEKNNIELQSARLKNIPVISRSEALSEVMRLKRCLVVAGTHGKTTTTGLLAHIFIQNKKEPTVVIGGQSPLLKSTAYAGQGEWFIAESDESDGGFKYLFPEIAVITNIDNDHIDYYGSFQKLQEAFLNFAKKVPFYGYIIAWGDQKILRDLLSSLNQKIVFYGFNKNNHFTLEKLNSCKYKVAFNHKHLGILNVPMAGSANALNALAACAAAMTVGLPFEECSQSIEQFKGVNRRMQKKGYEQGIEFYDDYAHHPTEIKAVLSAFREKCGKDKKLNILFQPHRFSRTAACWSEFLTCFKEADKVFLTDIYPANERPVANISAQKLAQEINHPSCTYVSSEQILPLLLKTLKANDIFVTMGAGSVDKYGDKLIKILQEQNNIQTASL